MNPRANERLVQQRPDGTCFLAIPAVYRDELGIKGGTIIKFTRTFVTSVNGGRGDALVLEVVGWQEPKKRRDRRSGRRSLRSLTAL